MQRNIVEEPSYERAVAALGGARAVDLALVAVIEALGKNPYGFPHVENDWLLFRYAITKPIPNIVPALCVIFTIDEVGDVHLQHVEIAESY